MALPKPAPGVSRRARSLAPKGGGVKAKLRRLWAKKIAGVPAPIVILGVGAAAYLVYRNRNQADTDYDETAADLSGGFGDEGALTSGVGGGSGDFGGGVIGLPPITEDAYPQPMSFLPEIFEIPRGNRRRRPRGGSRERVNRRAIREARRRAIERYKREQRERRQIIRRRIERQRKERRELKRRLEERRREHNIGNRAGPPAGGPPIRTKPMDDRREERRRRRRDRFRVL